MTWVREGSCPPERCKGRCCKHIGTWMDVDEDSKHFAKMLQIRGVKVAQVGDKFLVDVPQTCQWLTGRGLCSLHPDTNPSPNMPRRPQFCEVWPTEPGQLLNDPDCGFTFRWAEEEISLKGNL